MISMTQPYGPRALPAKAGRRVIFVMLWLAALVGLAGPAPARADIRILVLGDSLTAGYGLARDDGFQAQLARALAPTRVGKPPVTLVDAAVSGDTTAGGLARLEWALGSGVDGAIVALGANDGLRALDPRVMEANLSAILDGLAARNIPVLLAGMYAPPNLGAEYGQAFYDVYRRLAMRRGVIFDPFLLDGVVGVPSLNLPDRVHPNAAGVQHMVARILPAVERLVREAAGQ